MGQTGEDDKEDSNKKESEPPSYDSLTLQSMTSTNEVPNPQKQMANDGKATNSNSETKPVEGEKEEGSKEDKEKKSEVPPVGLIELFKFATPLDVFLIIFGVTLAFCCGSCMPILCILFGDTLQSFVDDTKVKTIQSLNLTINSTGTMNSTEVISLPEPMMTVIARFGYGMIILACAIWLLSWVHVTCLNWAAARQVFRVRGEFLRAILRQDIGWYDTNTATDFASKMTEDLNKLQEGIGEKIGMLSFFTGTFLLSIIVAFVYGWDLTLVIMSMIPFMVIFGGMAAKVQSSFAEKEMEAYGKAGVIAQEVLSGIRTVVAFGGQEKEIDRYEQNLQGAKKSGIIRGMLTGISGGLTFGIMYAVYGLGFWYGVKCIMDDRESEECKACGGLDFECYDNCQRYNPKSLLVVFFSVLIGGFQIGQSAPYAEALATARSAAGKIYRIIDRVPHIDSSSNKGLKPKSLHGNIKFSNIFFNYPSRKDVKILQGFSLEIPQGKTVALVGSSGCGKSTCIQLAQRFYDPESGGVEIDGTNIKELNIGWLRDQIGVVGQEPVLFDFSIKENIRLGNLDATDDEIKQACKEANALDFIMKLPNTFDTTVGEGGTQLSGGQKQRIAIARALVRNPKILLLDEATSALDTESEKVVQAALDNVRAGRTTIVVAHRLSTIRTADIIVAIDAGTVKEIGTHQDLMANKDLYYSLVMRQMEGKTETVDSNLYPNLEKEEIETNKLERKDSVVGKLTRQMSRRMSRRLSTTKIIKDVAGSDPIKEELEEDLPKVQMIRILRRNSPEAFYILVGVIASCGMGAVMPLFAVIFGDILGVLGYEDIEKARADSIKYSLLFLLLGFFSFMVMFLQGLMFGISGENLTARMRKDAFEAMLRQEIGWYDKVENNTGSLCARLSGDAAKVQGATGARVGSIMQGIAGVLIAVIMGLYFNWKLGLVCSLFFPLLIIAVVFEQRIIMGVDSVEKKAFEKSAKLAIEAISNIRTVAGLRCEERYIDMYIELLSEPHKLTMKKSHQRGFIFGFSQAIQFFAWGLTLWFGGYLVDIGEAEFKDVFTVTNAVIGGAGMVGYSFAFVADFNKAMVAAARVFQLLDRQPLIDTNPATGLKLAEVKGNVAIKDAEFSYPTRPSTQILNKLQLSIKNGESIALVGESGCGKSTVIQLIQRLYDVSSGSVELENQNIESLNLPFVRSKLGIVSQEPVLFDRTIAENIQYGDNSRAVSMEEVVEAARSANIHQFVSSLPSGYDTKVGNKGTQLSGGQKQRVAIARALVRNPRILLLDEATSALDTESEKVVQDALDSAQIGRTSITIAHRLSTIKGADQIYIIEKGEIVESGTHDKLLQAKGVYHKLWNNSAQ